MTDSIKEIIARSDRRLAEINTKHDKAVAEIWKKYDAKKSALHVKNRTFDRLVWGSWVATVLVVVIMVVLRELIK